MNTKQKGNIMIQISLSDLHAQILMIFPINPNSKPDAKITYKVCHKGSDFVLCINVISETNYKEQHMIDYASHIWSRNYIFKDIKNSIVKIWSDTMQ